MKKSYVIILMLVFALMTTSILAYTNEKISIEDDASPLHKDNGKGQGICIDSNVYQSEYKTNILGVRIT